MAITDFDSVFWTDPWMRKQSPHARYLFSYLFTGPHKNRAGMYPLGLDIMSFETGMSQDKIKVAIKELEPKVLYDNETEIVYVVNHVRHQFAKNGTISPKVAESIARDLNKIPKGHVFIDDFIKRYADFFHINDSLSIEYRSSQGKGRVKDKVKESLNINNVFEIFWTEYPRRNGRRAGKPATLKRFSYIPEKDYDDLITATKNYASSQQAINNFAKDPERFLKDDYWRDWIEPEDPKFTRLSSAGRATAEAAQKFLEEDDVE